MILCDSENDHLLLNTINYAQQSVLLINHIYVIGYSKNNISINNESEDLTISLLEVGQASTKGVVYTSILIIICNYLITNLMLN